MLLKIVREDGLVLQLAPGQTITIEKNNPLFNDSDKLLQDISWGSTAPFSEQNKAFFKQGHLVEIPNASYVFPIKFYIGDELFLSGNIKYRVAPDGFEFTLQPNLVAINSLLKNITMTDIRATDGWFGIHDYGVLAAFLKDTCVNPDKYPFYFFPVYNPFINTTHPLNAFQDVNHYDEATEQFVTFRNWTSGTGTFSAAAKLSPYFKLTYIYQQLANYLGLSPVGGFFVDPKIKNLAIYTREYLQGTIDVLGGPPWLNTSNNYMPGMLITDFVKQTRERLHIALDIDLTAGEMEVETFRSIYESEPIDISPYITNVIEQELPDTSGWTVALKSDDQDESFAVVNGDNTTYPSLFQLVAGDGSNTVELDCSTLRSASDVFPSMALPGQTLTANQNIYMDDVDANFDRPFLPGSTITDMKQWALRLVRWMGYNTMPSGRKYPEAAPYELDADDVLWYRFLNDSKRLIISALFPAAVLRGLKSTRKLTFKSAGYNYMDVIIEKISCDINADDELIPAKIYARTLKFDIKTPITIATLNATTTADYANINGETPNIMTWVRAYFDPALHGIDRVDFEVVSPAGSTLVWKAQPITVPANFKGAGGVAAGVYWISGNFFTGSPSTTEIRIRQGVPQYVLHNGIKKTFTYNSAGGYYAAPLFDWYLDAFADYFTIFF